MEAVKLEKPKELISYSKNFEPITGLSKDENELLAIKYKSKPLGSLSEIDFEIAVKLLMLKIYVITGWTVPADELKRILVDQLGKKIKESYPNINADEVEYAFRHNLSVKDWGKSMNLVLIDEVLSGYLEKRADVSRAEETHKLKLIERPKEPEIELTDEDFIEANRSVYKLTKAYGLLSAKCYDILVKQGKIKLSEPQKEEIRKKARSLFFAIENQEYRSVLSHDEIERFITHDCKKIAVSLFFDDLIKEA